MRWVAQALGMVLLITAGVPLIFDFEDPLTLTGSEALLAAGFVIIVAGLILAWRSATGGGLLILAGVALRWVAHAIVVGVPWPGMFYGGAALVGVLYLARGLRERARTEAPGPSPGRRRVRWMLAHAAGAGIFAALLLSGLLTRDFFATPWVYESRQARAARTAFAARQARFEVMVYPLHIIRGQNVGHEIMLTRRLARYLDDRDLADAHVSEILLETPPRWRWNQARMFRSTGELFGETVARRGLDHEYALMIQILAEPSTNRVAGIHYYLADADGHLVDRGMMNPHQPLWRELEPEGLAGAYGLLERWLCESWTLGETGDCIPAPKPEPKRW